ncbi:unnamed protein product, partial [Owenia fusiformis]
IRTKCCEYKVKSVHTTLCKHCYEAHRNTLRYLLRGSDHTNINTPNVFLSYQEILEKSRSLKKENMNLTKKVVYANRLLREQRSNRVNAPANFKVNASQLGQMVDTAIANKWLSSDSILFHILQDSMLSLQRQETQFERSKGKLTKEKKKPRPKGMRYSPLTIKWCCRIANQCKESGYDAISNILPIPRWNTIKQYRQQSCNSDPINLENISKMVQEIKRRKCKGVGG